MERVLGLLIVQVGWIKTYASMDYYIYFITKLCYYRLWGWWVKARKQRIRI